VGTETRDVDRQLEAITVELQARAPDPLFDFKIRWASTYDDLLGGQTSDDQPIESLLGTARQTGRVALHAAAGSGKTTILARLFVECVRQGDFPLLVDLRKWGPGLSDEWATGNDAFARANILLERLGSPALGEFELGAQRKGQSKFVLIDGLNEVPSDVAHSIPSVLDELAFRNPEFSIVLTDRLARRISNIERWQLSTIAPVEDPRSESDAETQESSGELMRTAFFLDFAIRKGIQASSGAEGIREYFVREFHRTSDALPQVAKAAFDAYAASGSRSFELAKFERLVGIEVTQELLEGGALESSSDGRTYFTHHLFHDFLASVFLVSDPKSWTPKNFDILTFRASSFDALALALEQIPDPSDRDLLARLVFDWNPYGPALAVARAHIPAQPTISPGMETALFAMLAERRWDTFAATAQRAEDALRLFRDSLAQSFLRATSLDEVFAVVRTHVDDDHSLSPWVDLFTTPVGAEVDDEVIAGVRDQDSLIGWTTANVLRRVSMTSGQHATLRSLLSSAQSGTVRWRVVHVLGAHPTPENAEALTTMIGDDDYWVRYGAVRSLMEAAVRSEDLRENIIERVVAHLGFIREHEGTLFELQNALLVRKPPSGWAGAVEPVLEELWTDAETVADQDRWRAVAYEIQRLAESA
jgi:hypothetical protein